MLQLNKEQLDFLSYHKLPLSAVFDASGLSRQDYRSMMKDLDKYIAIGVTPCQKEGHVLRLRSGHCVMCSTQVLAHFSRYYKNSYVYVAASKNGKKLKIGYTKNTSNREESLNRTKYGNLNDWKIIFYIHCENAGKIESEIQTKLAEFNSPGEYQKEGRTVACYELFQCNYKTAKDAIQYVKNKYVSENFQFEWEINNAEIDYNFERFSDKILKENENDNKIKIIDLESNDAFIVPVETNPKEDLDVQIVEGVLFENNEKVYDDKEDVVFLEKTIKSVNLIDKNRLDENELDHLSSNTHNSKELKEKKEINYLIPKLIALVVLGLIILFSSL